MNLNRTLPYRGCMFECLWSVCCHGNALYFAKSPSLRLKIIKIRSNVSRSVPTKLNEMVGKKVNCVNSGLTETETWI